MSRSNSIRSPDDGQGMPETCSDVLNEIKKFK
jgi:hypothetical protein